ncbi:transcription factor HES-7.1-B-like [Synchiropus picturatus]
MQTYNFLQSNEDNEFGDWLQSNKRGAGRSLVYGSSALKLLTEESGSTDRLSCCDLVTMKLISEQSRHTDRKILKPQVEKRRRERMNRSLENLKTLLMLKEQSQRRVEKAEILEQTVAFLHNHHKRSFHDGFSSCLQRATRFLGPDGKDLDSSMAARLSQPDSSKRSTCASLSKPSTSFLWMLLHMSKQSHSVTETSFSSTSQTPAELQRRPLTQPLWRPWHSSPQSQH